jgi:hypothetical protein
LPAGGLTACCSTLMLFLISLMVWLFC